MITEKELKQGIQLDNDCLSASYTGKIVRQANDIVDIVADYNLYNKEGLHAYLVVGNRVYHLTKGLAKYYSMNGRGKYYWLDDFQKLADYIKKPLKSKRSIQLIVSKDELYRKDIKNKLN